MVSVEANAKINLTLDILGVRPDGFHEVEMVMQSVKLFDLVHLEKQPEGISLRLDSAELPADETNLAWKAARFFLDEYNIQDGVSISVEKRIPIAAGLAGGSTDAAGVLIGMNRLFKTGLSAKVLCKLSERIGSDVPFCVEGGTMLAKGRGEILQRLPDVPSLSVVLAKPPVSVSTAWAYKTYDRIGVSSHPDTKAMLTALFEGSVEKVARGLVNVLEVVTMREYPVISAYKRVLMENGAIASLMSGSGPTVFGLAATQADAELAAQALLREDPEAEVFVVPTAGRNNLI